MQWTGLLSRCFIFHLRGFFFTFLAVLSIRFEQRQHHDAFYVWYTVCWNCCCSSCRISDGKLASSLWSLCCEYVLATSARPVLEQILKDKQTMALSESRQTSVSSSVPHVPNSQHKFQSKSWPFANYLAVMKLETLLNNIWLSVFKAWQDQTSLFIHKYFCVAFTGTYS